MPLTPGARIGPYEIRGSIGSGGMGEVCRATDTNLGRQVAIKVLPEAFAHDADRLARFEREAKVLASLNHPNIAAIYGLERSGSMTALVMELVEGDDLSQRIARGAIPLDEALAIAKQIADALEAAHEQAIVHRDCKPANVKVRPDGTVKVLDFGLAKAMEASAGSKEQDPAYILSQAPTITTPAMMTGAGMILGTAAYMSPEQARGRTVDKRTDIWAFGCVLFEMLTGTRAFAGDDVTDFIVAVMTKEPDWTRLPAATPPRLVEIVRRCLKKDPRERLRDMGDARLEMAADAAALTESRGQVPPPRRSLPLVAIAATIVVTAALSSAFWWIRDRLAGERPTPMHLSLQLPANVTLVLSGTESALSPDGRWIVYSAEHDGKPGLFLQDLREPGAKFITGTENATGPFFSADSRSIAFVAGRTLSRVSVSGGSPVPICDVPRADAFEGGAWGPDDRIVFVPAFNAGIWTVSASGGTPVLLLKTDEARDRIAYTELQVLPDRKGILFTVSPAQAMTVDDEQLAILEPGSAEPRVLPIRGVTKGRYVRTGHIVYSHRGALLAVPFDLSTLTITGSPTEVVEGMDTGLLWDSDFHVSETGTMLYTPRDVARSGHVLALVDRHGTVRLITDGRGLPYDFSLSPDGKQAAVEVLAVNNDIWVYDVADGTPTRLTFEPGDETFPQWTPDGRRIAFGTKVGRMFWKSADGTGQREEFPAGEFPRHPSSFSPDGKTLAFVELHPSTKTDVWLMPLEGDRKPEPLMNTDADEKAPKFSPNGRWLAYVSDETGRDEIWVRPVGSAGAKKRVSTGGGAWPVWNRNGREVFFLKGDTLASVALDADMNRAGPEQVILDAPQAPNLQFQANNPYYDVMPDGERFVMLLTPKVPPPAHYNIVVNWTEELKRLVPVN